VADEQTRIEIAFKGGQTIGAIASSAAVDGLQAALDGGGDGTYELPAEDGTYVLPLRAVVYVKRFSRETHIGFGRSGG
jgi:hypothetical protein